MYFHFFRTKINNNHATWTTHIIFPWPSTKFPDSKLILRLSRSVGRLSKLLVCHKEIRRQKDRNEPVDVTLLLLSVSPHTRHRLVIIGRVPVRIKHHQTIGTNQIQATPTSFAAQHEDVVGTLTPTITIQTYHLGSANYSLRRRKLL